MRSDDQHIIDEATATLPEIVAQFEPKEQPATGAWVAFTVRGYGSTQTGRGPVIHRTWFTWHRLDPLEEIDEATFKELTIDPNKGKIKVPVWHFELQPLGAGAWWLDYWFNAPLKLWYGKNADDSIRGYGVSFQAWRKNGHWRVALSDGLAM